jgi:hypothetical protein
VHVPNHDRKKLEPKSKEYIFVGYCNETKNYRLADCENPRRVIKARDVIFLEDQPRNGEVPRPERAIEQSSGSGVIPAHTVEVIRQEIQPQQESEGECSSQGEETDEDLSDNQNSEESTHVGILEDLQPHQTRRYPKRERKPREFPDMVLYQAVCVPLEEPTSVEEALSSPEREQWKQALDEEYRSLQINEAWELVTLPKGKKVVKSKWIFKKKRDSDGNIKYKALVAKGCSQIYGIDYQETFSPVVRYSTLRMLFSLAVQLDMTIDHMDVVTAFLNGDLKEEVYMEQPEHYVSGGNKVCLLRKAIYGLKQASKAWYDKIHSVLISLGFKICVEEG